MRSLHVGLETRLASAKKSNTARYVDCGGAQGATPTHEYARAGMHECTNECNVRASAVRKRKVLNRSVEPDRAIEQLWVQQH